VIKTNTDTFRNNPWIMNLLLICDKRQRDRERERVDTDTRIFRVHVYTRSLFQTITHTLTPKHTRQMCVCLCARVCLSYFLKGEQPPSASVYWYLDQTSACRLAKHQSKWLCSAVSSPATARPLQDRLHEPTRSKSVLVD
jgi:hypothetical protein